MAPVSNPAITVAVVIDTPTVGSGYGGAVSAPVFAQVAQEVLEYLGVPHDQPLKTKKEMLVAAATAKDDFEGVPADERRGSECDVRGCEQLAGRGPAPGRGERRSLHAADTECGRWYEELGCRCRCRRRYSPKFRRTGGTTSTMRGGQRAGGGNVAEDSAAGTVRGPMAAWS